MASVLAEAFRYNRWANLTLLDACGQLAPKQLGFTSPGTYGSIASTLTHLVGSERWYLWLLRDGEGRFSRHRKFPGIQVLREQASASGAALIAIAPTVKDRDVFEFRERGWIEKIHKSVILTQALHHGNDHRTHVCTILGAHRLPVPDMDVWAYGRATGRSVLSRETRLARC